MIKSLVVATLMSLLLIGCADNPYIRVEKQMVEKLVEDLAKERSENYQLRKEIIDFRRERSKREREDQRVQPKVIEQDDRSKARIAECREINDGLVEVIKQQAEDNACLRGLLEDYGIDVDGKFIDMEPVVDSRMETANDQKVPNGST